MGALQAEHGLELTVVLGPGQYPTAGPGLGTDTTVYTGRGQANRVGHGTLMSGQLSTLPGDNLWYWQKGFCPLFPGTSFPWESGTSKEAHVGRLRVVAGGKLKLVNGRVPQS